MSTHPCCNFAPNRGVPVDAEMTEADVLETLGPLQLLSQPPNRGDRLQNDAG